MGLGAASLRFLSLEMAMQGCEDRKRCMHGVPRSRAHSVTRKSPSAQLCRWARRLQISLPKRITPSQAEAHVSARLSFLSHSVMRQEEMTRQ